MVVIRRGRSFAGKVIADFEAALAEITTDQYVPGKFADMCREVRSAGCELEAAFIVWALTPLPRARSLIANEQTVNWILTGVFTLGLWWAAGWEVTLRVVGAGFFCAVLMTLAFAYLIPCGGFGEGFRLFYNMGCR